MKKLDLKTKNEKGLTLVELMIAVGVFAIISAVIAQLFLSGMRGWMSSSASIMIQQKARSARDVVQKLVRNASAASLQIGQYSSDDPPLSMLTMIDTQGNSLAFWQSNHLKANGSDKVSDFFQGTWELSNGKRLTASANVLIPGHVRNIQFYYPNIKDQRHLNFSIYLNWLPYADAARPIEIRLVDSIELRNP